MRKIALLGGQGIKYSLSPVIHNFWMRKYSIVGDYVIHIINDDSDIASKLFQLKREGYIGCNVTFPYKEKICNFIDFFDGEFNNIGAINTVCIHNGKFYGKNTDNRGFIDSLLRKYPSFSLSKKKVLILGAGGAAKAILCGLASYDVDIVYVYNRSIERSMALSSKYGNRIKLMGLSDIGKCVQECDLIINTLPNAAAALLTLIAKLELALNSSIVFDITYCPKVMTSLLNAAVKLNYRIVTGLDMLIHQAALAFYIWFDIKPMINEELYQYCLNSRKQCVL